MKNIALKKAAGKVIELSRSMREYEKKDRAIWKENNSTLSKVMRDYLLQTEWKLGRIELYSKKKGIWDISILDCTKSIKWKQINSGFEYDTEIQDLLPDNTFLFEEGGVICMRFRSTIEDFLSDVKKSKWNIIDLNKSLRDKLGEHIKQLEEITAHFKKLKAGLEK